MKNKKLLMSLALFGMLTACNGGSNTSSETPNVSSDSPTTSEQTSMPDSSATDTDSVTSSEDLSSEDTSSEETSSEEESSEDPIPTTAYYIYVGEDKKADMTENVNTDKTDGRLAEYMATGVELSKGDQVTIKDNEGKSYLFWEPETGLTQGEPMTAPVDGTYDFYFKLYSDGSSIYVVMPEHEDPNPIPSPETSYYVVGNFSDYVADEAYKMSINEFNEDDTFVEYMLKLDLKKNDQFKVLDSNDNWYSNFSNEDTVYSDMGDYVCQLDGEYTIYFKLGDGWNSIWVTAPVIEDKTKSTVYLSVDSSVNWTNYYIYYWAGDNNNVWPGTKMNYNEELGMYTFEIENTYTSIIFTDGASSNTKQTSNLTFNKETPVYYLTNDNGLGAWGTLDQKPEIETYVWFLLGGMNGWKVSNDYGLKKTGDNLYSITLDLALKAEFKVNDGGNSWYGINNVDSASKTYVEGTDNIVVKAAGNYTITFNSSSKTISIVKN